MANADPSFTQADAQNAPGYIQPGFDPQPPVQEENIGSSSTFIVSSIDGKTTGFVSERVCQEMRAEITELQERVVVTTQQASETREQKNYKIGQKTVQLKKVTSDLDNAQEKIKELESTEEAFLRLKNKERKMMENDHQKEVEKITARVTQLEVDNDQLQQALAAKEENHEQQLAEKEVFQNELVQKKQELERELSEKEEALEAKLVEKGRECEEKLAENEAQFQQQRADKDELHKREQAQTLEQLQMANQKLETCQKDLREQEQQLFRARSEEERQETLIDELKQTVEELMKEKEGLQKTIAELRGQVNLLNQQMGDLQQKNAEMQEKMDKCVTNCDEASEQREQTRQDLTKTQKELQELKLSLEMLLRVNADTIVVSKGLGGDKILLKSSSGLGSEYPDHRSRTPSPPGPAH